MMQNLSADFSRRNYGRARLLPSQNLSASREIGKSAGRDIMGSPVGSPSKFSPNEFGAQKKSVKSHVPCPVPPVPHWLKPAACSAGFGTLSSPQRVSVNSPHNCDTKRLQFPASFQRPHDCQLVSVIERATNWKPHCQLCNLQTEWL